MTRSEKAKLKTVSFKKRVKTLVPRKFPAEIEHSKKLGILENFTFTSVIKLNFFESILSREMRLFSNSLKELLGECFRV